VRSPFSSSEILVTLMKEALSSSETSVITRATLRNIAEDVIFKRQTVLNSQFLNLYEGYVLKHVRNGEYILANIFNVGVLHTYR
jgi:hypothetical protein